jgi:hypothetical protein
MHPPPMPESDPRYNRREVNHDQRGRHRKTRDNVVRAFSASILIGAACFAFAADGGTNITVSGWVIDSACAYAKGLDKPIGVSCAKACGGRPTNEHPKLWAPHPYVSLKDA